MLSSFSLRFASPIQVVQVLRVTPELRPRLEPVAVVRVRRQTAVRDTSSKKKKCTKKTLKKTWEELKGAGNITNITTKISTAVRVVHTGTRHGPCILK